MLKTLLLVAAGLAAGLAIAFWLQPSAAPTSPTVDGGAPAPVPERAAMRAEAARLAALEEALAAEIEQRAELQMRVAELAAELEALDERPRAGAGEPANGGAEPAATQPRGRFREGAASRAELERRTVERLIAGGFAPDRAEWINRRSQELRMQSLNAQYEALREGRALEPGTMLGTDATLRRELGDADYERYLAALDRPTSVGVRDVLASSPAESSGLLPGDEIVAYDGERVFDMRDLNALTLEGRAGESVVVDVRRAGRNIQLVMPRGPIGILGGGFRGR